LAGIYCAALSDQLRWHEGIAIKIRTRL